MKSFRRRLRRRAFTLVEALVSTSITAIAGSALLLGVSSSLEASNEALEQTLATGMAQHLMDEIAGKRYHEPGATPRDYPLGPAGQESAGTGRTQFDDIDDFNGYSSLPGKDLWGVKLGTDNGSGGTRHTGVQAPDYFDDWRQQVEVYYVSPTDQSVRLPAGQTSDYRAVEIQILINDPLQGLRPVTKLRRVFAYVPSA